MLIAKPHLERFQFGLVSLEKRDSLILSYCGVQWPEVYFCFFSGNFSITSDSQALPFSFCEVQEVGAITQH